MNVLLNTLDVVLPLIDLPVDCHQVLQALSDIGFVFLQRCLLLPYLLLYGSPLVLQSTDRGVGVDRRVAASSVGTYVFPPTSPTVAVRSSCLP